MNDRAEIINFLKTVWTWAATYSIRDADCPKIAHYVDGAIRLLEAQEARVLTLEELPGHDGAVFVEYSPAHLNKDGEWMFVDFVPTYVKDRSVYLYTRRGQMVSYKQYGVTWRAWTGRPTEEQMEAEAWE